MKNHHKHPPLQKPKLGNFGRNEWAILGTTCGDIQNLSRQVVQSIGGNWKIAYVDADHHASEQLAEQGDFLRSGAKLFVENKIKHYQIETAEYSDEYQRIALFRNMDLILINGNHFQASRQIVVIDPRKEKSLLKRKDQLTQVDLILLLPGAKIYSFLPDIIPNLCQVPVLAIDDTKSICQFFVNQLTQAIPALNGLVLAGGKSLRMGFDKGNIDYHGIPQREYLLQLLATTLPQVFLSCRPDQLTDFEDHPTIADRFLDLGGMGAILTAFSVYPDHAFLVTACDLPFINQEAVEYLVEHRNPSKMATAFLNPATGFPDPLFTIWEPKAYHQLLHFLSLGYSCPRKVLINNDVQVLNPPDPRWLQNVNTQAEMEAVKKS